MTYPVEATKRGGPDQILLRLPGAAWATLPMLAITGAVFLAATLSLAAHGGGAQISMPVVISLLCAPLLGWSFRHLSIEIFEVDGRAVPIRRALWASLVFVCVPGLFGSMCVAGLIATSAGGAFPYIAVGGAVIVLVATMTSLVALPLAIMRPETRLYSVLQVAFYAVLRRPIPPFAVVVAIATVAWAAAVWLPGGLLMIPALVVPFAIAASWSVLLPAGVSAPTLRLMRLRTDPTLPK